MKNLGLLGVFSPLGVGSLCNPGHPEMYSNFNESWNSGKNQILVAGTVRKVAFVMRVTVSFKKLGR